MKSKEFKRKNEISKIGSSVKYCRMCVEAKKLPFASEQLNILEHRALDTL